MESKTYLTLIIIILLLIFIFVYYDDSDGIEFSSAS